MNKIFYLLVFYYLIAQSLCVIPEWNLAEAGEDLLGSSNEKTYLITHRKLYNEEIKMEKKIIRDNTGVKSVNYLTIGGVTKNVSFEQVESFYELYGIKIICPKGTYHPYNFNTNEEIIPYESSFVGENWDLRCFLNQNAGYFLVYYLMNGLNKNVYLTNTVNMNWYDGGSINNVEIYDYLLKSSPMSTRVYQMVGLLGNNSNLELNYLTLTLKEGSGNQHTDFEKKIQNITTLGKYTQAYFKNNTDNSKYFYYFTYNDISDFKTGYSTSAINTGSDYNSINNITIKNNDAPHLEFFNDMEIEELNFLLYNKFLNYKMKDKSNSKIYRGIFDIELNKIIFNTDEEITTFIPYSELAVLAITKNTAYKICLYTDNNNCVETCSSNKYLLDISGNKCGSDCPTGKYLFKPSGVCINECDESIYIKEGNICQLCKDKDKTKPYKYINGTECLSSYNQETSEYYNEKLYLLKCKEGFHLENNICVSNMICYELCKNCTAESTNEDDQKCGACINGFVLDENNNCRCPSGSAKQGKNCNKCTNTCEKYKLNSCDCLSCSLGYYLVENKCEKCNPSCLSCEEEATKCTNCNKGYFLDSNKCYECSGNCKQNETDSCKCSSCIDGYYLDFYQCKKCSEICQTCNGGIINDLNHNCLSCGDNTFLINDAEKHICVEDCSVYNATNNNETKTCVFPNNNKPNKENNNIDYMLWIFVAIVGILLVIISICICRKCCIQKGDFDDDINEMEGELVEK